MRTAKVSHPKRAPRVAIAIMAAGKGTRLKSKHPKVLHEVGGKPLLAHVIAAATKLVPAKDVYAIIGHEAERVRNAVAHTGVSFVLQKEQRGTGHALMTAREALKSLRCRDRAFRGRAADYFLDNRKTARLPHIAKSCDDFAYCADG